MNKGLQGLAALLLCAHKPQAFPMRHFFPLLVLSSCMYVLGWSLATQPFAQDNPAALHKCMKLHPERYCRLAHAPSTLAP